ncbi:MAG: imidazolonepropionase [Burkholderiales bacterium]|nr:imidazolonepropionase [Burkholderiales bacterium]
MWDSIWVNAHLATLRAGRYGVIRRGALAVTEGRIAWVGAREDLRGDPAQLAREVHDCRGRWITPGLIDCHTHLVYAGNRAHEFELRLQGATDEEIARAGEGIASTLRETRDASEMELIRSASARLKNLMDAGVTTVEIKSGYGLDAATELKLLRVARLLGASGGVTVKTSFLGAHALPPDYRGRTDAYVDLLCAEILPAVAAAGLADAVDAVCEGTVFSAQQTQRLFKAAAALHLPVKLHADQFADAGGAALSARFGALSADHLEYASEDGVRAMAQAGTVAVLLPVTHYFLRQKQLPPVDLLRSHGVPIALASDCNPGSSPSSAILLMLNMACTIFGLTPEEALAGVTCHAAQALGLGATLGTLEDGKDADFALWDIEEPAELAYALGDTPCAGVVKRGQPVGNTD